MDEQQQMPTVDMSIGKLIGEQELAQKVGLSLWTVKKMARNGEIPGIKLGNKWKFNGDAVQSWLLARAGSTFRTGPAKKAR